MIHGYEPTWWTSCWTWTPPPSTSTPPNGTTEPCASTSMSVTSILSSRASPTPSSSWWTSSSFRLMTSASASTIRSQHKFVAYVDTTWPCGATEQARWSRLHQHRLGDDEVLPRHPDALEDRWAVLREGNGFSYNVTHGDEIIGRQGILRDGYHDVAGFPKRGRHVLDDHCGAAKQRRIELAGVGFVGPDRNHDDVVGQQT